MLVQIYEIQRPREAERCIQLGVDHVGSVLLSREEWRQPELREVISMSRGTRVRNSLIPLFQEKEPLFRALDYYRPHYVHLCDTLTNPGGRPVDLEPFVRLQEALKEAFPQIGIIRSLPVPPKAVSHAFPLHDLAQVFEPVSDLFLTDTWLGKEPVEGYIGITGMRCDTDLATQLVFTARIPVILAGGLSPENVYSALMEVLPAGADSCTQTNRVDEEKRPLRFEKDFHRVGLFVKEVRRAEADMRSRRATLEMKLENLQAELKEREAALPPHSVRPQQILAIEALEDELEVLETELRVLEKALEGP